MTSQEMKLRADLYELKRSRNVEMQAAGRIMAHLFDRLESPAHPAAPTNVYEPAPKYKSPVARSTQVDVAPPADVEQVAMELRVIAGDSGLASLHVLADRLAMPAPASPNRSDPFDEIGDAAKHIPEMGADDELRKRAEEWANRMISVEEDGSSALVSHADDDERSCRSVFMDGAWAKPEESRRMIADALLAFARSAPTARATIKMPERKDDGTRTGSNFQDGHHHGWNLALDRVAWLNPFLAFEYPARLNPPATAGGSKADGK